MCLFCEETFQSVSQFDYKLDMWLPIKHINSKIILYVPYIEQRSLSLVQEKYTAHASFVSE